MAIDAKVSSPENYDKVQGNDQVAMINAKLGTKMNVGTDKYMFQDKGPKNDCWQTNYPQCTTWLGEVV